MKKGKIIKNLGLAMMIFGLIFMVIAAIQSSNTNYVSGGLVIVSLGALLNRFGKKKMSEN